MSVEDIPEFIKIDLTNLDRAYIYYGHNNYLGIFNAEYIIYNIRTNEFTKNKDTSSASVSIYKYRNSKKSIDSMITLSKNNTDKESFYKSIRDQYSGDCNFFEIINGDLTGFYCDFEKTGEIKEVKINDRWSFVGKIIDD